MTLDRCTRPIHKGRAILQNPRISVVVDDRYFGLESCLPDHLSVLALGGNEVATIVHDMQHPICNREIGAVDRQLSGAFADRHERKRA